MLREWTSGKTHPFQCYENGYFLPLHHCFTKITKEQILDDNSLKHKPVRLFIFFSLEDVPMTLKILRRRKLEEEARAVFDELLKFHGSAYIRYGLIVYF